MNSEETVLSQNVGAALNVANRILFSDFTSVLEEISKIPTARGPTAGVGKNEQKRRILKNFLEKWRSTAKSMAESDPANKALIDDNFFQVLRLLLPKEDRRIYNIKEAKLASLITEALGISKTSDDGKKLLNYRQHNSANLDGDFAGSAYFVLKKRSKDTKKLTIFDINTHLDKIAESQKTGQNAAMSHFLFNLSAEQMKWLIRIILKDLKIGIQENFILEVFHPDALDYFNVTSSLEKICDTLKDPLKRLNEIGVSVMTPCRPMLGKT
jgi:DNA ligase-4